MKQYTYFPGCSASEGEARAYGASARAVCQALDMELKELKDWNCCGSTPAQSVDELGSFCLAARNLALAEKTGRDMVTPCSACYVIFNRTNAYLKEYPHVREKVADALSAGGLEYRLTVKPRHLLDIIVNDAGVDQVKARVKRDLGKLKVAPYYGCQVVRPNFGFDHPENPQSLEKLIASLGGEPVPFPLKTRCCGGSLILSEENAALDLIHRMLVSAANGGAECIATVCPICQFNLDAYQGRVNKLFGTHFNLPVLFFTQLMGLAFGLEERELGLKTGIVPVAGMLARYS